MLIRLSFPFSSLLLFCDFFFTLSKLLFSEVSFDKQVTEYLEMKLKLSGAQFLIYFFSLNSHLLSYTST